MQVLNPQDGMEAIKIVQWNRMEIVSRETQLENMSIRDINELRRCNQLMQQKFSTTGFFLGTIFSDKPIGGPLRRFPYFQKQRVKMTPQSGWFERLDLL